MKRWFILAAMLLSGAAAAQPYPNKPIRFIVPFAPGGNLDFIARVIQPKLAEYLGVAVVIENKPGASGIIGAEYRVEAAARRLHDLPRQYRHERHLSCDVRQAALRSRQGLRGRRTNVDQRFPGGDASVDPGQDAQGVHRLCEGEPRESECRARGRRVVAALRHRIDPEQGRHRHAAGAVQGQRAGTAGRARGSGAFARGRADGGDGVGQGRKAARPRRHGQEAPRFAAGRAHVRRGRACRAWRRAASRASSCLRERRPRSSRGSRTPC